MALDFKGANFEVDGVPFGMGVVLWEDDGYLGTIEGFTFVEPGLEGVDLAQLQISGSAKLKAVYVAALVNTLLLATWGAMFEIPGVIRFFHFPPNLRNDILSGVETFLLFSFLIAMAPLVFLIRRPKGWGKLLLPVYGLSWVGHAAMLPFVLPGRESHIVGQWVPAACGLLMFALAITHQLIDPSFFRRHSTLPNS